MDPSLLPETAEVTGLMPLKKPSPVRSGGSSDEGREHGRQEGKGASAGESGKGKDGSGGAKEKRRRLHWETIPVEKVCVKIVDRSTDPQFASCAWSELIFGVCFLSCHVRWRAEGAPFGKGVDPTKGTGN